MPKISDKAAPLLESSDEDLEQRITHSLGTPDKERQEAPSHSGWSRTLILAMFCGPIGGFILGWDAALTGIKIISISHQLNLSHSEQSTVLVIVPATTLVGAMWAGLIGTSQGRRKCVAMCAGFLVIAAAVALYTSL